MKVLLQIIETFIFNDSEQMQTEEAKVDVNIYASNYKCMCD